MQEELVSIIIPTRERPDMLLRAVKSALGQTYRAIEVIVVLDGPDEVTKAAVATFHDQRLRIVFLGRSVGGSDARNAGVEAANGAWVAFLDDDDEWLPEKLSCQLSAAIKSHATFPFVSCRLLARTPRAEYVWPRRLRRPGEHLSDYLFTRKSVFRGEGSVQTSTFFGRREFFLQHKFRSGLLKHQDTEFVLRLEAVASAELIQVDIPLVIHHIEEERPSVSSRARWEYSLKWVQSSRPLFTTTAYGAFVLNTVGAEASNERAWRAIKAILKEAVLHGNPRLKDYCIFAAFWLFPQRRRRQLRDLLFRMLTRRVT